MTRPCKFCGNPVPKKPKTRKYCSRDCYFTDKRKYPLKECAYCGVAYYPDHGDRPSLYCSNKCQGDARVIPRVTVTCPHCGTEITRRPSEIRENNFCSYACRAYVLSVGNTIGVKLHQDTEPSPYSRPYWRKQASRARKRDGYRCQDCGDQFEKGTRLARGVRTLDVHHIIPIRLGGSDHLSNLLSLCRKCHRKADAIIQAEERLNWPEGVPRPKHVRKVSLPNHCKNGHPYTPENTLSRRDNNGRRCRTCDNANHRRRYHEGRRVLQISLPLTA